MKTKLIPISLFMLLIMSGMISCQSNASQTPTPPKLSTTSPDIRGTITKLISRDNKTVAILVEGKKESDTKYDKATIGITDKTKIFFKEGNGDRLVSINEIKEGLAVEVLFTGDILESNPPQTHADEIIIHP